MDTGVAIFPSHDAIAPAEVARPVHWLPSAGRGPVERAQDRYKTAIAELYGE